MLGFIGRMHFFGSAVLTRRSVMHVQLLRSIRPLEFVTFAGNGKHGNSHKKDGK
jgi:hypothetical protein